jgi:hypothetical protein
MKIEGKLIRPVIEKEDNKERIRKGGIQKLGGQGRCERKIE